MDPAGPKRSDWHTTLAVALVILVLIVAHVCVYLAPYTWINRDGRFYTNMNVTIVEDFSLEQSRFASSWYNGRLGWNRNLPASFSNIAVGRNGEYWPMHPWLMPVLSTPLFFAFGIPATLMFNLLVFGLIAFAAYRFVREYARPAAAALAIGTLLLGTSVRDYAYDYHVDILLLGLFSAALWALVTRRGWWMGVLLGMALIVKPTCVLLLPAVGILLWERGDLGTFRQALAGGAAVLFVAACANTYLFGRPWWFGYNRVLTVENGMQKIVSDAEAFSTPLGAGIQRMWSGRWGLSHRQTLMALALPGLLFMLARRRAYAVAALLTATASFFVFAKYHYQGDRFHWPAIALLLPALAQTYDLVLRGLRALGQRLRRLRMDERNVTAALAALLAVLSVVAVAPFGAGGGRLGLVLLHTLAAAMAVFAVCRLILRLAPPALAVCAAAGPMLLPLLRDTVLANGAGWVSAALAILALELALGRRWLVAGALGVGAAWVANAPWLAALSVLVCAAAQGRAALLRAGLGVVLVLVAWGLVHWVWLGGLFAGPKEMAAGGSLGNLANALGERGAGRFVLVLGLLALPGLILIARRDWRPAACVAIVLLSVVLPGVVPPLSRGGVRLPLLVLVLAVPLAPLSAWVAERAWRWVAGWPRRRLWQVGAGVLAFLLLLGTGRRLLAALEPFRLGSVKAMRSAEVMLGEVPCDFIPWEHMSWECSHLDKGHFNQVGLALPDGVRVGGKAVEMLLIPTGLWGQPRSVRWREVEAGGRLAVRYASPDRPAGGVEVAVVVDGQEVDRFQTAAKPDGRIHQRCIDTSRFSGRKVDLWLWVRSLHRPGAAVAVDAGWEEPCGEDACG